MTGTVPYDPSWSCEELARTITENELLSRVQLQALVAQKTPQKTLAVFVRRPLGSSPLSDLVLVARGADPPKDASHIMSASVFISNALTDVDVYRMNA